MTWEVNNLYSFSRDPSNEIFNYPRIGDEFKYVNISGPDDFKIVIKTNYAIDKFWKSLGLRENANLFNDY